MPSNPERVELASPATFIPGDDRQPPATGTGLCLSGGGYRAMLFHVGSLWRLHEAGWLNRLDRISSVSGGSITAGVLAMQWAELRQSPDTFQILVADPLRRLADRTIDAGAIIGGLLLPGSVADRVAAAYRKHLFGDRTLQDLPDAPRFIFNATNLQSGALWRFSKPYMADYRVGLIPSPRTSLAVAVAASSAFPPVLSPVKIELNPGDFEPGSGRDLQFPPFTTEVVLTDGGVYDNLGLETVWKQCKTVLVSNAGGKIAVEGDPDDNWIGHTRRVLDTIDNQVRSLRVRQVIAAFIDQADAHDGAYWGIRVSIADFGLPDSFPAPLARTMELAQIPTRLQRLDPKLQERLINWGYASCDAALRKYLDTALPRGRGLPYATPV